MNPIVLWLFQIVLSLSFDCLIYGFIVMKAKKKKGGGGGVFGFAETDIILCVNNNALLLSFSISGLACIVFSSAIHFTNFQYSSFAFDFVVFTYLYVNVLCTDL